MKKALMIMAAVFGCGFTAVAAGTVFDLGSGDQLSVPGATNLVVQSTAVRPDRAGFLSLADSNRVCEIRVLFKVARTVPSKNTLKEELTAAGQQLLPNAEEKELTFQEIPNSALALVYFELTDKRSDPGDGKYLLEGMGTDGTKYVLQFRMLSNLKDSRAKKQILDALSSMRIELKH